MFARVKRGVQRFGSPELVQGFGSGLGLGRYTVPLMPIPKPSLEHWSRVPCGNFVRYELRFSLLSPSEFVDAVAKNRPVGSEVCQLL